MIAREPFTFKVLYRCSSVNWGSTGLVLPLGKLRITQYVIGRAGNRTQSSLLYLLEIPPCFYLGRVGLAFLISLPIMILG